MGDFFGVFRLAAQRNLRIALGVKLAPPVLFVIIECLTTRT
jgi:hypothetical protein